MEKEYRVYESDKGTQRASRECHMETEVNYIVRKTVFVRCEIFHKNMGFCFSARILKMPVKQQAICHPNSAAQLFQILITTTCQNMMCQKGQFAFQSCLKRWLMRIGYYSKESFYNLSL